mmetsp:Transcript_43050/g.105254  ORF Transcript_43050/g.105254 Transcript_43050/m.105254 type:complete len:518 (-) Transcript_43050:141-1694(-)
MVDDDLALVVDEEGDAARLAAHVREVLLVGGEVLRPDLDGRLVQRGRHVDALLVHRVLVDEAAHDVGRVEVGIDVGEGDDARRALLALEHVLPLLEVLLHHVDAVDLHHAVVDADHALTQRLERGPLGDHLRHAHPRRGGGVLLEHDADARIRELHARLALVDHHAREVPVPAVAQPEVHGVALLLGLQELERLRHGPLEHHLAVDLVQPVAHVDRLLAALRRPAGDELAHTDLPLAVGLEHDAEAEPVGLLRVVLVHVVGDLEGVEGLLLPHGRAHHALRGRGAQSPRRHAGGRRRTEHALGRLLLHVMVLHLLHGRAHHLVLRLVGHRVLLRLRVLVRRDERLLVPALLGAVHARGGSLGGVERGLLHLLLLRRRRRRLLLDHLLGWAGGSDELLLLLHRHGAARGRRLVAHGARQVDGGEAAHAALLQAEVHDGALGAAQHLRDLNVREGAAVGPDPVEHLDPLNLVQNVPHIHLPRLLRRPAGLEPRDLKAARLVRLEFDPDVAARAAAEAGG